MAFTAFANTGPAEVADAGRRRKSFVALFLLLPGVIYLALTYVAPLLTLVATSFKEPGGNFDIGEYVYAFRWENFTEAFANYGEIIGRTFVYAGLATFFALIISYPLAYFIGVKLRNYPLWQSLALILVIAPFFISFLLRTLAWKQIFSDQGIVVTSLQAMSLLPADAHITGTPFMVVFGLTYNFLPFMCLPIYASLERLDLRYVEAGSDLYAPPTQRFLRIILPLSLPGVISGVLLVFIPAAGDFINAAKEFLGSTRTTMAGNVINDLFFQSFYPVSAAMSIILMVITLIPVAIYVARSGSEELL
jgi:spermidine/putrescine transport system permease protein